MSEHTYCDRCGMEITGERHRMGEVGGRQFGAFYHQFDLCGGCFKDWKNWLPRSTRPEPDLDAPVQVEQDAWVELPTPNGDTPYIRVSCDGEKVQERSQEGRWNDYDAWWIKAAFRAAQFPNGCWKGEVVRVEQPAAKAALDALSAEGDAEWVELNGYWRVSVDGIKVQRRDWCEDGDPWVDTTEAPELVKLYRTGLAHGLSVAQAEHEALREQVRALVEEILSVPLQIARGGWIERLQEAAKRVQL